MHIVNLGQTLRSPCHAAGHLVPRTEIPARFRVHGTHGITGLWSLTWREPIVP